MLGAVATGCAADPIEPDPVSIEPGTVIEPQQYLADSAGAADAVSAFMGEVEALGSEPTPALMSSVAPSLEEPLESALALSEKLSNARLDDTRLEAQRTEVAESLQQVVESMERLAEFVAAGDRLRASSMTTQLAVRVDALRDSVDES